MSTSDAQKSEVHDTTGDADTSPVSNSAKTNPDVNAPEARLVEPEMTPEERDEKFKLFPPGTHVVKDDSDNGGPIVIDTD